MTSPPNNYANTPETLEIVDQIWSNGFLAIFPKSQLIDSWLAMSTKSWYKPEKKAIVTQVIITIIAHFSLSCKHIHRWEKGGRAWGRGLHNGFKSHISILETRYSDAATTPWRHNTARARRTRVDTCSVTSYRSSVSFYLTAACLFPRTCCDVTNKHASCVAPAWLTYLGTNVVQ